MSLDRDQMNAMQLTDLCNEAERLGLLDDLAPEQDAPDREELIDMILDYQNDARVADEMEADRQAHYDRLDEEAAAREDQDGSDDYC